MFDSHRNITMTSVSETETACTTLDAPTAQLIDLAAVLAAGTEGEMRASLESAAKSAIDPVWVEELLLQTYLFAGFPRTLNGMRLWRRASNRVAETSDFEETALRTVWTSRGETTCENVYGTLYKRLRANIRTLHPALDTWMIDLYGRVLGRPGLDLKRRELCIVAACAALEQDRQLHSHLHGAVNAGASREEVDDTLRIVSPRLGAESKHRYSLLWARVRRT
ncbi:MAG TPA: carboxymuconolactone decarboxylase family protein [Gemmatimonadaceae bacterium]|nr:carboxymuconolactone decarboxylase family protein [Gemmatimonadaceae bacterium]